MDRLHLWNDRSGESVVRMHLYLYQRHFRLTGDRSGQRARPEPRVECDEMRISHEIRDFRNAEREQTED
jgi:hypothetical protein